MIDERLEAQASLYVLGALPPEEASEFERSARADLQLQMLVKELRGTADALVATFPQVRPPASLRQSVLDAVERRSSSGVTMLPADFGTWQTWIPWALAACFALLCLVLLSTGHSLRRQIADLRQENEEQRAEANSVAQQRDQLQNAVTVVSSNYQQGLTDMQNRLQRKEQESQQQQALHQEQLRRNLNQAQTQRRDLQRQLQAQQNLIDELQDALFTGPGAGGSDPLSQLQIVVLNPTPDASTRANAVTAFSQQEQRGLFVADTLAALPRDRDYQLWLFDPQQPNPVSAGVFSSDATGHAKYVYRSTANVAAVKTFAVSIERKGGAPQPQGKVILVSN